MTANVHIHLKVSDLARSLRFYEKLWGAPVKVRPDYAKFLPSFAPLNLALSPGDAAGRASGHYGVQVSSPQEVQAQLARVRAAGLPVREERGVDCCHANQDKFWVRDPDGVEWEIYHLNRDLEEAPAPQAGCCP